MNIIVRDQAKLGYWYINEQEYRALFRFYNQKADSIIQNKAEEYKTIEEFLSLELKSRHVKMIIPHKKYVYSPSNIICSHTSESNVRGGGDNNLKITHCNKQAKIYSHVDGKPVCFEHAMH